MKLNHKKRAPALNLDTSYRQAKQEVHMHKDMETIDEKYLHGCPAAIGVVLSQDVVYTGKRRKRFIPIVRHNHHHT